MASPSAHQLALSAAYEDGTPAPSGWKRKLIPRIGKGMIPIKTDVIFISPDGQEIKSKSQLQRYLKAQKHGLALSEFNWSPGETPRRSTRLTFKIPMKGLISEPQPKKKTQPPSTTSKRKSTKMPPGESGRSGKRAKKAGRVVPNKSEGVGSKDTQSVDDETTKKVEADEEETISVVSNGEHKTTKIDDTVSEDEHLRQEKMLQVNAEHDDVERSDHDSSVSDTKEESSGSFDKKLREEESTESTPKPTPSDGENEEVEVHVQAKALEGDEGAMLESTNGQQQQFLDVVDDYHAPEAPSEELTHTCANETTHQEGSPAQQVEAE